jgi:hypothetical protein
MPAIRLLLLFPIVILCKKVDLKSLNEYHASLYGFQTLLLVMTFENVINSNKVVCILAMGNVC